MNSKRDVLGSAELIYDFDDEASVRVFNLCRRVADRCAASPLFSNVPRQLLLDSIYFEVFRLLVDVIDFRCSFTGRAPYMGRVTVLADDLGINLTARAFENYSHNAPSLRNRVGVVSDG